MGYSCGLNDELNGKPPREKSSVISARIDCEGNLMFYGEGGRALVAAELGIEPLSLYVC